MALLPRLRSIVTLGRGMMRGLSQETAGRDPIVLFGEWLQDARRSGVFLFDSVALATCTRDGTPSVRMMLLKGFDERGFVFYTNYESRKADQLLENPRAAMAFHWPVLERQIRVEGDVEKISTEESEVYFRTRLRGSCIGAWASKQSARLTDPEELHRRFREYDKKFGKEVPLPPFWGGYRLKPRRIEFWQGRLNRLHDRVCYEKVGDGWEVSRLYP